MNDITARMAMGFSLDTIFKTIGESMTERIGKLREVSEMNEAVWKDAYDWLENHGRVGQGYLDGVRMSVERGYTPDEIFHQIIREAGDWRLEIAERCRAAANHIIAQKNK